MATIIKGRSPMDDYKKIQMQVKYSMRYAPPDGTLKPDCEEKLKEGKAYNIIYKLATNLLKATGICVLIDVVVFLIFNFTLKTEFMRVLCIVLIVATIVCFFGSLILLAIGSSSELRAEKKDRGINISLDTMTWILQNGQIAVSDEQKLRCRQMYDYKTKLSIAEAPFKSMKIIESVYSVTRTNGMITADAQMTELYRKHPYVGDSARCEEEDSDLLYYYCVRDKREKIMWYENMYGREMLLQALDLLTVG